MNSGGLIPREVALRHRVAPRVRLAGGRVVLRAAGELSDAARAELSLLVGGYLEVSPIDEGEFSREFEETYPEGAASSASSPKFRVLLRAGDAVEAKQDALGAPLVRLVDELIGRAIEAGASDIHLEPREERFSLRYRLDGVLQEQPDLPRDKKAAVISRLKIMADLDIAERRRPQDGRIRVEGSGRAIDLRVSVIPTDFGERMAIRILDKAQLKLDLGSLGMVGPHLELFKEALARPNGIVLVTGPTGSGKTTTLYAALNFIKNPRLNILTIEDPIEYNLDGVSQSQVKREIGYDFAGALRTFLRQDPDVILVGEIRDLETAEIAIRASLTGHLVLSTLHTNDAASAATRLMDIGIEPYLAASSLNLILAQRLVRTLCPACRVPYRPGRSDLEKGGMPAVLPGEIFRARGCPKCRKTGYIGRTAVFEFLPVTGEISQMIHDKSPAAAIRASASAAGMSTLRESGMGLVLGGLTTLEELDRVA